jgi:hypothetical protein
MPAASPLPSARFNQNFDWIVQNFSTLAQQHPNRWIAVDSGRVLAADPDLGVVKRAAAGQAGPDDIVYYFVDDGSLIFTPS